ncbi:hypothetical protein BLNAU_3084 [Blattamonas nauphoetae]|uniref:Uncharacterized protein n=1 Tax=Blattamonas nauphoetae TaxID=2049346 RepID=A0ABQ9YE30_9EUKA|nr:hypothetical protein BLNAU_3084 [Blattamonas nauphoetae]
MPPKHKLGRKQNKPQSNPRTQRAPSSTSDTHLVHLTITHSKQNDTKSSLDPPSISITTDVVTITANDRYYVRVSKQILQNELKRKRINVESLLEQALLEGDEISLPASAPSDWRLVLQDSITADALKQGCISLFEQVQNGMKFSPIEVFHAVRFLEYATIHIEYRETGHASLIESIFPEEVQCQTKLTSALIKLVCHPSDKLREASLSFFDVYLSNSRDEFLFAVAATGLLPQLFEHLKPHEIPLNRTTLDFHRHFTSIMDNFFRCSSWRSFGPLTLRLDAHSAKEAISKLIGPLFQPFCAYLRYLIACPACPTDSPSGISLLSNLRMYKERVLYLHDNLTNPELQRFFDELRKNMTEELVSSLGLETTKESLHRLLFGERKMTNELRWVEIFEEILARLSEGRQFSDLGLQAFWCFMFRRPNHVKPVFRSDGTFSLRVGGKIQSTLELPSRTLGTLITTRPHYVAAILDEFHPFTNEINDDGALLRHLKDGWFASLFNAITLLNFPFTNEFMPLHTQLVRVMQDCLYKIQNDDESEERFRSLSQLNKLYLSLHKITRNYVIHLSLHPYAIVKRYSDNPVLDFLTKFFRRDFEDSVTKTFREKLRKDMDESALSSSSPPFILTSELVCPLTDEEIMNVVDRIVALLESDSPISDDTILRICTFTKMKLKSVYLPELFRKAGRSTEQYFHALNSLLSLPLDHFDLHPINSLLTPKPKTLRPTFNEWDDVDLTTVGVMTSTIHKTHKYFVSASPQLLDFVADVLPRLSHCASRLTLSQLERLIAPSINLISKVYLIKPSTKYTLRHSREDVFLEISRLCEQRVIAQCLSRIGFFSHIVGGLLDDRTFNASKCFLNIFLLQTRSSGDERAEKKMLRRRVPHFLEEGWQDVLEFLVIRKKTPDGFSSQVSRMMGMLNGGNNPERDTVQQLGQIEEMMNFYGANL